MKLALMQFNPTVGAIRDNATRIVDSAVRSREAGADLLVLPELALCGYPPRDLLVQEGFVEECRDALLAIAPALPLPTLIGLPWRPDPQSGSPDSWLAGGMATNSAALIRDGRLEARYDKRLLPTYDVFDEHRYFRPGDRPCVFELGGTTIGVAICEDLWRGFDMGVDHRYAAYPDPMQELVDAGARLIVVPSASPFVTGKGQRQRDLLKAHVSRHNITLASVNQVGGNDDLIFDGHAAIFTHDPAGPRLIAAGPGFEENVVIGDLAPDAATVPDPLEAASRSEVIFRTLVLGVRDYCRKTGFERVVLGLSGGIDSALTAAVAAAALGPDNVLGVTLPSRYSSAGSVDDSQDLAARLGIGFLRIPIEEPHTAIESLIGPAFAEIGAASGNDVTEENIQARIRGVILMAFANKTRALLLNTGNKSELAVGYCTLYGDMNGAIAVLADVTKVEVYRISRWVNEHATVVGFKTAPIPDSTLTKPPSAELRPDQRDQDTLPPYEILDDVIERHVERLQHPTRIVRETGYDAALVARIIRLIDINEYKRKQAPIGLKVTSVAFGRGRRRPIAQAWRPEREL